MIYQKNVIGNNHEITKMLISNCKMIGYEVIMADYIGLRQITIYNCQLQPDVTKQVLMVLKYMRHLETVDLSGNDMTDVIWKP